MKKDNKETQLKTRYVEGVGRRKTAVARVRLAKGHGAYLVNGKSLKEYFRLPALQRTAAAPLENLKLDETYDVSVRVKGGGVNAQAEAVRLGLARALVILDPELKKRLRGFGFLMRDPRMVERKKYGLKKARGAPQGAKR